MRTEWIVRGTIVLLDGFSAAVFWTAEQLEAFTHWMRGNQDFRKVTVDRSPGQPTVIDLADLPPNRAIRVLRHLGHEFRKDSAHWIRPPRGLQ